LIWHHILTVSPWKGFTVFFCFIIILGGLGHLIFTVQKYNQLNFNAYWTSSGVLLAALLAFFNLVMNARANYTKSELFFWHSANILSVIFSIIGFYVMREIKSGLMGVNILALFICAVSLSLKKK